MEVAPDMDGQPSLVAETVARPSHVPVERVVDFNLHQPVPGGHSAQRMWREMIDGAAHDILWTPYNGGHWVVLDPDFCETILADSDNFSSRVVIVPREPVGETYSNFIPLSLDPPANAPYRKILNEQLGPKQIAKLRDDIRELTVELIEKFRASGRCNFVHDFAEQLPLLAFLRLCELPEGDLPQLKHLALQFTRPDGSMELDEVERDFRAYIGPVIRERRGASGQDLISRMVNAPIKVRGEAGEDPEIRTLTDAEAENLCIQVLVGGLDTVANMLGFVFSYLATHPDLTQRLGSDSELLEDAMTEFLRRFPVVSDSREVRHDLEFGGVKMKKRDMVMASTIAIAMNEKSNEDALDFRIDRAKRRHSVFGRGTHACPGMHLARLELRIVLEEWLSRIPEFRVAEGQELSFTSGVVATVDPFELEWDVGSGRN